MNNHVVPDAESAILGCMLGNAAAERLGLDMLQANYFYIENNRRIFGAIKAISGEGKPVDVVAVLEWLRARGLLEHIAGEDMTHGAAYLTALARAEGFYFEHAHGYAKMVAVAYYEREIVRAAAILAESQEQEHLEALSVLVLEKESLGAPPLKSYASSLSNLDKFLEIDKAAPVRTTGIKVIDDAWDGGASAGEISTWAAATSVGKSLMLLNLMHHASLAGQRCLYVGTEMEAHETMRRHLSVASGVAPWRIRKGVLRPEDRADIIQVVGDTMHGLPIDILDKSEPSLADVEAAIIASRPDVVFLDYLDRFELPDERDMRLRVKEFMRQLKTQAQRRKVIVHLAAQLGRGTYSADERAPNLTDLSESSAIERESDRVMLMWVPSEHNKDPLSPIRTIEVIQAKNRNGKRGVIFHMAMNENNLGITEKKS